MSCDANWLDPERPALQREALPGAGQDRISYLVEELADRAVALLGDSPDPVEFAELVPVRDKTEVGAGGPGSPEPARVVDGGGERGLGLHT